jgi:hypothetical protein
MASGPRRSGAADAEQRARNMAALNEAALALVERCDACRRVGGPSTGADEEAERFRARGRPVYAGLAAVPGIR